MNLPWQPGEFWCRMVLYSRSNPLIFILPATLKLREDLEVYFTTILHVYN
jgi:hypothetical protein